MESRYRLRHWRLDPCCELHKRTEMMYEIIQKRNADDLREMLESGWDLDTSVKEFSCHEPQFGVNRYLGLFPAQPPNHHQRQPSRTTALDEAAARGWLQGVEILLNAGAKWSPGFREQLSSYLEVGNYSEEKSFAFFKTVVKSSIPTDINTMGNRWQRSLLWELVCRVSSTRRMPPPFMVEYLDLFYQNNGNINMEFDGSRTLHCHSNSLRWLIRHGGDISYIKLTYLNAHFIPRLYYTTYYLYAEVPLILLRAGLRVSHRTQRVLRAMQADITAGKGYRESGQAMEAQLEKAEREEPHCTFRKRTFPEYWTQQVVDLQEFSDESLNVYPEDNVFFKQDTRHFSQYAINQIDKVLEFVSQTQSLEWHCRRCVRENLVSLEPSVVKTLPIPAVLKRYVLCHEL